MGWSKINSGDSAATVVDPAAVLRIGILANATSIIVGHNHPSGNLEASKTDKCLTERIKKSGDMLGIGLVDHIILTVVGYM